jgi:hypothetical protein
MYCREISVPAAHLFVLCREHECVEDDELAVGYQTLLSLLGGGLGSQRTTGVQVTLVQRIQLCGSSSTEVRGGAGKVSRDQYQRHTTVAVGWENPLVWLGLGCEWCVKGHCCGSTKAKA